MICRQFRKDRRLNNQSAHRAGASADSDASAGCSISGRVEKNLPCLFLVVALALGVPFTFLNPPLQAPDEFAHFFRAYGVSEGQFVAHDTTSVPQGVVELVREFPPKLETDHRVREQDLIIAAHEPLQESYPAAVRNEGMGMYSFVPYLSAAAAIRLGRLFSVSPLVLLYLGRLANAITYVLLVYLALRLLPDFRFLLFCLALVPTALSQGNSLSTDAISFAVAFLFAAYLLKLAFDPAVSRIQHRHQAALGVLIVLAALCKADIILLLLAGLISSRKFSSVRARYFSLGCYAALAIATTAGWNFINAHNLQLWQAARLQLGISLTGNWQFVLQHPLLFLGAAYRTIQFHAFHYLDNFVSTVGWLAASIPAWAIWSYFALLLIVAFTQTRYVVFALWQKVLLAAVVSAGMASVFIMLWGFETPASYAQQFVLAGVGHVPGVQGRHFIPFAFPCLLILSNTKLRLNARWLPVLLTVGTICLTSGATWMTIRHTFYVPDVATRFTGSFEGCLVKKPGNGSDALAVYFIENGRKRPVTSVDWVRAKGLKWPSALKVVRPEELDAIPSGPNLP